MARNNMLNNEQPKVKDVIMEEPITAEEIIEAGNAILDAVPDEEIVDVPAETVEDVVNEIIEEEKEILEDTEENQEEQVSNEVEEIDNNISNEIKEPVEEPVDTSELAIGDRVKINSNITTDAQGRRIHNGIKNYSYTIKVIRPDGYCAINCLAYDFTVHLKDLQKI